MWKDDDLLDRIMFVVEDITEIEKLEKEMKSYAKGMEFEKAAMVRDQISDLRNIKIK